ncbi:MAG: transcription antitermination factor NusB [Desulfobacterales bacterium]|jgi:N utilization substance protein B
MGNRRRARELAMQALYFIDMSHRNREEALSLFCRHFTPSKKVEPFFIRLAAGVLRDADAIDGIIEGRSEHWRVDRMACVDRNVIRIAVFEMMRHPETPARVIINEAIDIGKKFGTDESGPFINGILDSIRIGIELGDIRPMADPPTSASDQKPSLGSDS